MLALVPFQEQGFEFVDNLSRRTFLHDVLRHERRGFVQQRARIKHGIGGFQALDGLHHGFLVRAGYGDWPSRLGWGFIRNFPSALQEFRVVEQAALPGFIERPESPQQSSFSQGHGSDDQVALIANEGAGFQKVEERLQQFAAEFFFRVYQ